MAKDLPQLSDAAAYLLDTSATLVATLSALPAAAPHILSGSCNQVAKQFAVVHDVVVPHACKVARSAPDAQACAALLPRLDLLALVATRAVHLIIVEGLLARGTDASGAAGPSSSAAAQGRDAASLGERLVHSLMDLQVRMAASKPNASGLRCCVLL
jgi:hypothetical protein